MEQPRSTLDQETTNRIEEIAKELRMQGKTDEEAEKLAKEEVKKIDEMGDKAWNDFIKKVQLGDILDDSIRRQLLRFRQEAKNKGKEVDFKLEITKRKVPNTIYYSHGILTFAIKIDGNWIKVAEKVIEFKNWKEAKDEKTWKFQLYDSMLQVLVFNAIGHVIVTHKYNQLNPNPNGGEQKEVPSTTH